MHSKRWHRARWLARRLARSAAALFVLLGLPWPAAAARGEPRPVTERVERLRRQLRAEATPAEAAPEAAARDAGDAWTDWNDWDDWAKWANSP